MDEIANLLGQLYRPEVSKEVRRSPDDNQQGNVLASGDNMNENFSQFSDNAVLSPPTANNQQVLLADHPGVSVTDEEQLVSTSTSETMLTACCSGYTLASSPQPLSQEEDLDHVTELESPDLAQPVKEVDERTADTIILPTEDANTENNKERPFKITPSGLYFKHLSCLLTLLVVIRLCPKLE